MATKKTMRINVETVLVNLDKTKKSLESLQDIKLMPQDTASIKAVTKAIEEINKKYPKKTMDIVADGEAQELKELSKLLDRMTKQISNIQFPEWEIEAQIKATEEYQKKALRARKQEEKVLNAGSFLTKDRTGLSDRGIAEFKASYQRSHGEGYAKDVEYYEAREKAISDYRTALTKAEQALENAQKEQREYLQSQKDEMWVAKKLEIVTTARENALEGMSGALKKTATMEQKVLEIQKKAEEQRKRTNISAALKDILGYNAAIHLMNRAYRETIETIKGLDKAFTEMAMVSNLTREEAWWLEKQLFDLANQTGATATEVSELTTFYLQQGRSLKDAIELTEVAAKSAKVAGIATKEAADLLTTALNGFGMAASQAEQVADKFARLAAVSATDFEEMATALSKVASQANMAGMSMDFTLGLLAKGIETTREGPESIGTALKTVIARMQELSDFGKTLEDGMDVNRVETMLKNLGISLRDSNGELRNLEDVITELGYAWEDLSKNQKAGIAVALAGTRQQSRLIAMMDDFQRTMELTNEAQQANGSLSAQHRVYMEGLEASLNQLTNAYQEFVSSLSDNEMLITLVDLLKGLLQWVTAVTNFLGKKTTTTIIIGVTVIGRLNKVMQALKKTFKENEMEMNGFKGTIQGLFKLLMGEPLEKMKGFGKKLLGLPDEAETKKEFEERKKLLKKELEDIDKELEASNKEKEELNAQKQANQQKIDDSTMVTKDGQERAKKGAKEERNLAIEQNKLIDHDIAKNDEKTKILEQRKKATEEAIKNNKRLTKSEIEVQKENLESAKTLKKEEKALGDKVVKSGRAETSTKELNRAEKQLESQIKGTSQEIKKEKQDLSQNSNEVKDNEREKTELKNTENVLQKEVEQTGNELDKQTNDLNQNTGAVQKNDNAKNNLNWGEGGTGGTNPATNLVAGKQTTDDLKQVAQKGTPSGKWSSVKSVGASLLKDYGPQLAIAAGTFVAKKLVDRYNSQINGEISNKALTEVGESQEKLKSIKSLSKELKDLNGIAVKTEDQFARINEILGEIEQIGGDKENLVALDTSGEMDYDKTLENIEKFEEKQEKKNKEKLLKARKAAEFSYGATALAAGAGALIAGGVGFLVAGPGGAVAGAKYGAAAGTAIMGIAQGVKERQWMKNKDNQETLKELAKYRLQEAEYYKNLDEETQAIVQQRAAAARNSVKITDYKEIEDVDKAFDEMAKDIADIEGTKDLTKKLKEYKESKHKENLKAQYGLLALLAEVENGDKLSELMEEYAKRAKDGKTIDEKLSGISLNQGEDLLNAFKEGFVNQKQTQLGENAKLTEKDYAQANKLAAQELEKFYKDYENFINTYDESTMKAQGISKTMTGYILQLQESSEISKEVRQALYDSVVNIKTTEQIAQSTQTLLSKVNNFTETMAEFKAGQFDTTKFLDLISSYSWDPKQIAKLASGDLDADALKQVLDEEQQNIENEIMNAIKATKRLRDTAVQGENESDDEFRARKKAYENEIETYKMIGAVQLTALDIQQRKTKALGEYNKKLEEFTKLTELGFSNKELEGYFANLSASFNDMETEYQENIQNLVDKAGGAVKFNEFGMAVLDLGAIDKNDAKAVQAATQYYEAINEQQMEFLNKKKAMIQMEVDLDNQKLQEQRDSLQERLSSYEEYMDEMDRLEKESETNKNREDIAAQLARLGTATDAESLKRRKELTKELEQLNKAQLEDERSLTKRGLQEQISTLDEQMQANTDNMAKALKEAATDFATKIKEAASSIVQYKELPDSPINSEDGDGKNNEEDKVTQTIDTQNVITTLNVYLDEKQSANLWLMLQKEGSNMILK